MGPAAFGGRTGRSGGWLKAARLLIVTEMDVDPWRDVQVPAGRDVALRPLELADRDGITADFETGLEDVSTTIMPDRSNIDVWLAPVEADQTAGRALPFTVLDSAGEIAGVTPFLRLARVHLRAEICGTIYARKVQRTALNTEAKLLLLRHSRSGPDPRLAHFRGVQQRRGIDAGRGVDPSGVDVALDRLGLLSCGDDLA